MEKILHFLFGCLYYEISGQNVERFLNLCAKNDIVLWDLKPDEKGYCFYVRKSASSSVQNLAQKTHTFLKNCGGTGLPFFLLEHRKRKAFFFSVSMGLFLIFLLSQFIWEITVSGSEIYSENDILKYVTSNYYKPGTYKKKIDCNQLEDRLREDYEDIAWVSCSLQGTQLHIEIKETLDRKTKQNSKKPCDIVANKDGIITKLSVKSGTPLVSAGDRIKKGTTLISGLIYYYSDDFQVTETDKITADGEIYMKTREAYKETIPEDYYEKKIVKTKHYIKSIYLGSYHLNFPKKKKDIHTNIIEKRYPLKIGSSFYLPAGFYLQTMQSYQSVMKKNSKKQAEMKLKSRLNVFLKKKENMGIKILHQEICYKKKGNGYTAEGYIIQEEKVGKIRNIKALTKKQEEKIMPTTASQ